MGALVYKKQLERTLLSELVPVLAYDDDFKVFTLADGYLGFGFEARPIAGTDDSLVQRLNVLFSFNYPTGSFIQVMELASQDIEPTLDAITKKRRTENSILLESLRRRNDMYRKGLDKPISRFSQTRIRDFKIYITVKIPIKSKLLLPSKDEWMDIKDLRLSFQQTLVSVGFDVRLLEPDLFLKCLGRILYWGDEASWRRGGLHYDKSRLINEQISEPDAMLEVDASGVWLSEKRIRFLSPVRLPANMDLQNMRRFIGDPLVGNRGINGNFFINLNIYIPDNSVERGKSEKERNAINYQAFGPIMKLNPKIKNKKESADLLYQSISEGDRIVKVMLTVGLFEDSLDLSSTQVSEVRTYFSEIGWHMKEDKYIALPLLINCLPFCADASAIGFLQRYKRLGSKDAIQFLPILGDWYGTGTPQLSFVSRSGQIMAMDIYDTKTNNNLLIAAQSGSGKSFLTNDIITSYVSSGSSVWIIDDGESYKKLVNINNGNFLEFNNGNDLCISPFRLVNEYNQDDDDLIFNIIKAMASEKGLLSEFQQARLKSIVTNSFKAHHRDTTIDVIADQCLADSDQRVIDIGHQLFEWRTDGKYGKFVNGETTIDLTNRLTAMELKGLKGHEHLQLVVLLMLIFLVEKEMHNGPRDRRKLLIIDEAWNLLRKGNFAHFIEVGYRSFRKYNGSVTVITQSINDLFEHQSGVAIIENSSNIFLLKQKHETIESLRSNKRLMLSEGGYRYLKSVDTVPGEYAEIFFKTEYGLGIGRLIVDDYTKLLYTTNADEVAEIERRTNAGMSVNESINDMLRERAMRGETVI